MTPDLLAALRETPGCGEDPACIVRHTLAVHHADDCDPCLTRLAEAVLNHYGPTIMGLARTGQVISSVIGAHVDWTHDWPSLLTALRSETPR